jgi:protein-S-isoprenylcysteine O-methyltransferase Ste14
MSLISHLLPANTSPQSAARRALTLDIAERVIVFLMFTHFGWLMLGAYHVRPNVGVVLIMISEIASIVMIVLRRFSTTLSQQPLDWLLAIAGCCTPLLAIPGKEISDQFALVGAGIMLVGLCVQISAKAILFRSFGIVAANRGVKTLGPYRFVRHPMYAGYVISHFGYVLGWPSMHNFMLYTLALIIQMARLLREEELLGQDPAYQAFMARVRYRLLPGVF